MRKRVVAAVITLLLFCTLFLMAGYNLHMVLSGQRELIGLRVGMLLGGLAIPKVRGFFLMGVAFSLVGVGYMLFGHSYLKYKSDMQRITPQLQTPRAEGQGQYGTARWMEDRQLAEVFDMVWIDKDSSQLRWLMAHGRDDLGGCATQDAEWRKMNED